MQKTSRYLGIRVPQALHDAVNRMAEATGISKSQIIREAIESYVVDYYTSTEGNWKITMWNFLGTDSHRINFALGRSNTAEEFFSLISRWVEQFDVLVTPYPENITVMLRTGDLNITSTSSKRQPKEKIISEIILDLEEKYMEELAEDI